MSRASRASVLVRRSNWLAWLAIGVAAPAAAAQAVTPGPGCDPSRPAVAHYAGGELLDPQPANAPIACGVYTGFPGGETRIETGACGTLMYAPAAYMGDEPQTTIYSRRGLALSEDPGATWRLSL